MKKALRYIRSMRFGLILLVPVLVCAVAGSAVPQGESESYYAAAFPSVYHLILGLGLDHIFRGPVFLALTALFGLNLAFCSVHQLRTVPARSKGIRDAALCREDALPLTGEERIRLERLLSRRLWRRENLDDGQTLFSAPRLCWYGSVFTHFALLGVLIAAAAVFGLTSTADYAVMPGENLLPNGESIYLESFRTRDDTGRIEYTSTLEITAANGRKSGLREIRVNHPLRFGSNKYYQQSYGVAGVVTVTVKDTGYTENVYMTEQGMISVGGADGIWYDAVYPGYVRDAEGNITVIPHLMDDYPDPIYYILRVVNGEFTPMFAFPGDEAETGDAYYLFSAPMQYPSIRVKTTPVWVYGLLYFSFTALVAGLYLCFFQRGAVVVLRREGYVIAGKRAESDLAQRLALQIKESE